MKRIYTLHQYGSPTHFYGLVEYARRCGYEVKHREFYQRPAVKKLLLQGRLNLFVNLIFLASLPFRAKTKVVLAMAPYNRWIGVLMWLLKRHEVYYFTSFTCWDQSVATHPLRGDNRLLETWRRFTSSYVKHIFAVSKRTKEELIENNFCSRERISVVNHSYNVDIAPNTSAKKRLEFVQVAFLTPKKGTQELIELFKKYPECRLTLAGRGDMQSYVVKASEEYSNIRYIGFINDFNELVEVYKSNSFLFLNSQRLPGSAWEEFFGMAVIEGMACGCVPLTTDHAGPKEIISSGESGIIYSAENLEQTLQRVIAMSDDEFWQMRERAVERGQGFHSSQIADKWSAIDLD